MLKTLVFVTALAMRGDVLYVDAKASPGGDGSADRPYQTFNEAVSYANGLDRPVVIQMAAGRYEITDPVKIERSMTIRGVNQLEFDADGLPTGKLLDPAAETRIVTSAKYSVRAPMIFVGKSGEVIYDVEFEPDAPTRADAVSRPASFRPGAALCIS